MLRALMIQAVLWDVRCSQKVTKLLMDDFYDIPQLFDEIFFSRDPCLARLAVWLKAGSGTLGH